MIVQNVLDLKLTDTKILLWIQYLLSCRQNETDLGRIILLARKRQN